MLQVCGNFEYFVFFRFPLCDFVSFSFAVAAWKTASTTTTNWHTNWHTNADSQHHTDAPSQFQGTADSQTINLPPPVDISSDVANSTNCSEATQTARNTAECVELQAALLTLPVDISSDVASSANYSQSTQTAQITAESDSLQTALLTAEQKSSELLQQLHDRESDHMQLKLLRHEMQERFADLQSSVTAFVTSSHQRLEKDAETPVVVGQLQQLTSDLSHVLSSISNTESRVRVELLKHDMTSVIAEQELAQALADIVVLRRRNSDLEQEVENLRGEGNGSIDGYALRGSKFSSREKELENAVLELKNEVADRDKCILCLMEQMNAAAASHEEAVHFTPLTNI
jgi:chromosome segregation ATPase